MDGRFIKTCSIAIFFLLVPVLVFAVMGYFRGGDIGHLESGIGGVGSGVRDVAERTANLEKSVIRIAELVNGVETISSGITKSVQQNERGLSRIKESVDLVGEVILRIREEGITEE